MEEIEFSSRARDRILKVARTLADLKFRPAYILKAIQCRSLDRKMF